MPVRPDQSCPQWIANTGILTAEIHRLRGVQWLALRLADRISLASEVLGRRAERRPPPEWADGGGI